MKNCLCGDKVMEVVEVCFNTYVVSIKIMNLKLYKILGPYLLSCCTLSLCARTSSLGG